MNIDSNQVAHLTIQEFHDTLIAASEVYDHTTDENVIAVQYVLVPDVANTDLSAEHFKDLQGLMVRYNEIMDELRNMDCAFHDITEQYC